MNWILVLWAACLGSLIPLAGYLEKSAQMRGTHRKRANVLVDKAIRVVFYIVLTAPSCVILPVWLYVIVSLMYLPFYIDQREKLGGRRSETFVNLFVFRWIASYFSLKIVATAGKLDPKGRYIVGVHPHGLLPVGTMINLLSEATNVTEKWTNGVRMRSLAASFCFYIPIYRDILLGGGIIDAARYNALHALKSGFSLFLVPGGATEALYASPGRHAAYIKKRRGFIKLALETGASLVPVYSFGEVDCYNQLYTSYPQVKTLQFKFQRVFGLSLPLVTHIFPRRVPITTVIGAPIKVKKVDCPTDEMVEALLATYIENLEALFNKYAPEYIADPKARKLEIH